MARPALEISKLTPAERLQLVEELWESLCDTPEAVPRPKPSGRSSTVDSTT